MRQRNFLKVMKLDVPPPEPPPPGRLRAETGLFGGGPTLCSVQPVSRSWAVCPGLGMPGPQPDWPGGVGGGYIRQYYMYGPGAPPSRPRRPPQQSCRPPHCKSRATATIRSLACLLQQPGMARLLQGSKQAPCRLDLPVQILDDIRKPLMAWFLQRARASYPLPGMPWHARTMP